MPQRGAARHQVFALEAAVVAAAYDAGSDGDGDVAAACHQFLRDDGVATDRHDATGHDASALARVQTYFGRMPRRHGGDNVEYGRRVGIEVFAAQGIAIHGRVVVAGDIDR